MEKRKTEVHILCVLVRETNVCVCMCRNTQCLQCCHIVMLQYCCPAIPGQGESDRRRGHVTLCDSEQRARPPLARFISRRLVCTFLENE